MFVSDFQKVKEHASGKCRLMTSPWTGHLINPESNSNMADWQFSQRRECAQFSTDDVPVIRSKLSLNCETEIPSMLISETHESSDIYSVDFGDKCLSAFVEHCCIDENPVPNVIHYIWFGDQELGFFNLISLMSVLR